MSDPNCYVSPHFVPKCFVLQTLLVAAQIAASFAQESSDASKLEGRNYFGYGQPIYGGYGYGLGYGGYYRPYGYGGYGGYGYGLGYRSGEQPAEAAQVAAEAPAPTN